MKRLLPLFALLVLTSYSAPEPEKEVYICNSKTAKKYHFTKDCRGLNNCKHDIIKVKLSKAKDDGRTLCGWED